MTEILVTGEPGRWRANAGSRFVGELRARVGGRFELVKRHPALNRPTGPTT